jgi:TPR repeat protein
VAREAEAAAGTSWEGTSGAGAGAEHAERESAQGAAAWAAAQREGDAAAQCRAAVRYAEGTGGVEQSWDRAAALFRKAADQGFPEAQRRLATCYRDGRGVERDFDEAVQLYITAADRGDLLAIRMLGPGVCDPGAWGLGTVANPRLGLRYIAAAARRGHQPAIEELKRLCACSLCKKPDAGTHL